MSYGIEQWWPGGATVSVEGTFTKDAVGTDGILTITLPSDDDEAIFMYGTITIGAAKAGGADTMLVVWSGTTVQIESVSMNASEVLNLPTAFADAAVAVANSVGMPDVHQLLLTGADGLQITLAGMANTETYIVRLRFRSKTGAALTVTPTAGAFA
jgi:hypothetical protein